MAGLKIRKGDRVRVLTGKDRGKEGNVMRALPREGKVIAHHDGDLPRGHFNVRPDQDAAHLKDWIDAVRDRNYMKIVSLAPEVL